MPDDAIGVVRRAIYDPGQFVVRGGLLRDGNTVKDDPDWPHEERESLLDWQARAVLTALERSCPT